MGSTIFYLQYCSAAPGSKAVHGTARGILVGHRAWVPDAQWLLALRHRSADALRKAAQMKTTISLSLLGLPAVGSAGYVMDDSNVRTAVAAWLSDATAAEVTYGHISTWDMSGVMDMSGSVHQLNCRV